MPKAVLIMDMPESCGECPFCRGLNECKVKKYLVRDRLFTIFTVDAQIMEGGKPSWCPLRELPEKIPELKSGYEEVSASIHRVGWNACLNEIMRQGMSDSVD